MKKMAFLFLTALMTISLNAQTTSLLHEESASSVGKNWITGEDITAKEHLFSGEIAIFYYDRESVPFKISLKALISSTALFTT